ncbi:MAG: hypothetical protein JWO08_1693 [Verrucomicrobiaceae bacterium]|nr:hypothetical protein [Verrucomicrobiaceae bacterium]
MEYKWRLVNSIFCMGLFTNPLQSTPVVRSTLSMLGKWHKSAHDTYFPQDTTSGPAIKQTNADMAAESKSFAAMMKKIQKGSSGGSSGAAPTIPSAYGGGYTAPAAGPKIRTGVGGTATAV